MAGSSARPPPFLPPGPPDPSFATNFPPLSSSSSSRKPLSSLSHSVQTPGLALLPLSALSKGLVPSIASNNTVVDS